MPGEKNWAEMNTSDLENAARDNHDRPLGTFMGDYQVKGKEGPEEAVSEKLASLAPEKTLKLIFVFRSRIAQYLENRNPFGETSHPLSENARGDVGQAYGGYEEEDGY